LRYFHFLGASCERKRTCWRAVVGGRVTRDEDAIGPAKELGRDERKPASAPRIDESIVVVGGASGWWW